LRAQRVSPVDLARHRGREVLEGLEREMRAAGLETHLDGGGLVLARQDGVRAGEP